MAKHTITIERDPSERGRKTVRVNGEVWATVNMDSMGPRGVRYYFQQVGTSFASNIRRQIEGEAYSSIVYVEGPPKLLPIRLADEVRRLITEGLLRSPKKLLAAAQRERKRRKQQQERTVEHALARDRKRVLGILDKYLPIVEPNDAMVQEFIKLLAKARTE